MHLKQTQTDSLFFLINSFHIYLFLVLFQMALIPFTMSRYTIASLSNSKLNDYLPLNKSMSIHIYLGYTMVCFSIMATVMVSFFFFCCIDWQCMMWSRYSYFYHSLTHIPYVTSIHIQFFAFLGLLCSEGEGEACDKLTSEIMITGYCIMALLVSVALFESILHVSIKCSS